MFIDPATLADNLPRIEEIEKASMRLVTQALVEFRDQATEIYAHETDKPADIGEDITREALDRLGVSRIDQRLFGKVDYKKARYIFHPEYALKQALFVDSKAEDGALNSARLQVAQTSMRIKQVRAHQDIDVQGLLPTVLLLNGEPFLTTTVFVKYHYQTIAPEESRLTGITIAALPNGMLQSVYNANSADGIWLAGPDAPTLGEAFRVRLSFARLKAKSNWRIQRVPLSPLAFRWED